MYKVSTIATTLFCVIFFADEVNAQIKSGYKWAAGLHAGMFIYQGDLTPYAVGSYKTPSFTFGGSFAKIFNPYFSVRANVAIGSLRGSDAAYTSPAWRQKRNLIFSSSIKEAAVHGVWNIYGNNSNEIGLRITPYLFTGVALSFLNVNRDYSKMDTAAFFISAKQQAGLLQDIATTPPKIILAIPAGVGLAYYISPRLSVNFETTFRYTFTDYIDGFSHVANPNKKDFYHSHTIGLVYKFGGTNQFDCPKY